MRCGFTALVAIAILFGDVSIATAQQATTGAGKVEIGGFPVGGTFFVGGDDDEEVDFNVYSFGGNFTYYFTERVAVEGEVGIGLGWGQDVLFHNAEVFHSQMPIVWSYFGNLVYFPGGTAGKSVPFYITGGFGALSLHSREQTTQFGYDDAIIGSQTFTAENLGAGVKIFRTAAPDWGFRADYRYLIVNANSDAPAFFAKTKSRGGHRIYFGLLYTWKR